MKQTYVARIIDGNGNMIDFERFCCKRPETVRKYMHQLFENDLYRACTREASRIEIWATPDGYHDTEIVAAYDVHTDA